MTSTKNHVWINVHFPKDVHAALKAWCHRNGRSMQDGLVEMVALSSGPNGLRLAQPVAAAPIARAAVAPARTPDPPPPPPKPEIKDYETDDERFERERNELDPDALYARQLSRGETPEAAREQVKDWCRSYDVHEDWEPASDEEIH
jgi:hypothetical protein